MRKCHSAKVTASMIVSKPGCFTNDYFCCGQGGTGLQGEQGDMGRTGPVVKS